METVQTSLIPKTLHPNLFCVNNVKLLFIVPKTDANMEAEGAIANRR